MVILPIPGMLKMDSTTVAPESSPMNVCPTVVTIGMSAFFKACLYTTVRSLRPLARAVRM